MWLVVATAVHRLAQLPPDARREYAERAAAVWRDAPTLVPDEVSDAFAHFGEPDGSQRMVLVMQGMVEAMENAGAFQLAYTMLAAVRATLRDAGPRAIGLVLAQQARVARQLGELDVAFDLYDAAAELAESSGDRELAGRALLGKGNVACMRGNYPEAGDAYVAALAVAGDVPAIAAGAHHGLMIRASVAGDVSAALSHGWEAFESAAGDAARRADLLINLAELCQRVGEHAAALHGYRAALVLTSLTRLRLAALGGAAVAAAHLGDEDLLAELTRSAEAEMAGSGQPYENARTWLELAEAHMLLGENTQAARYLAHATELARSSGFHEIQYRADALEQAGAPRPSAEALTQASRAVVLRLAGLPENADAQFLAG